MYCDHLWFNTVNVLDIPPYGSRLAIICNGKSRYCDAPCIVNNLNIELTLKV